MDILGIFWSFLSFRGICVILSNLGVFWSLEGQFSTLEYKKT